jgi:hypothetical protein
MLCHFQAAAQMPGAPQLAVAWPVIKAAGIKGE